MATGQEQWFQCEIDRKTLKSLCKRRNAPGLIHFGIYFAVLTALGVTVVLAWASWWAVPALLLYCMVWAFANANGHESCHSTTFRSGWLNDTALYISSWMLSWEPETVRWMHAKHHSFTSIVPDDAEYALPNPIRWRDLVALGCGIESNWFYHKVLLQLAFGSIAPVVRDSVPDSQHYKLVRNARWFVISYLLIIAGSIYLHSLLPICLLLVPRLLGEPMHGVLRILQHGGLATGVRDHRLTTRTLYINTVIQFFYCNMNFHIEHHMFPMVPFHSLPALHRSIKDQLPTPSDGVMGGLGEVLRAMRVQKHDPDYVLRSSIV